MSEETEDEFAVSPDRSFFAALRAVRHLYIELEQEGMELHSNCEICDEARNFMSVPFLSVPDYPVTDFESAFVTARNALRHLYTKAEAEGMKLDRRCYGCIEVTEFANTEDFRGNVIADTLIFCDECNRPQPLVIGPMTIAEEDNKVRGDLMCGVCNYIVTTLTVREQGEYEFVKVENLRLIQ